MTHIILFVDNSRKWITAAQFEAIIKTSATAARGMLVDGNYITFGSISRILDAEEFYTEFPDERPELPRTNAFEELGFIDAGEILLPTLSVRVPEAARVRALEGLVRGLRSYIDSPQSQGSATVANELRRMEQALASARLTVS